MYQPLSLSKTIVPQDTASASSVVDAERPRTVRGPGASNPWSVRGSVQSLIGIVRSLLSADFGIRIVSTPCSKVAIALSAETLDGSVNDRANVP